MAAFAGVTPGLSVDGRSLLPVMRNRWEANWRKRFLVEYLGTVETGTVPPKVPFSAVRSTELSRVTPPHQFYVQWHDGLGSHEFYDLRTDRYQVASQHDNPNWTSVRNMMAGWLAQFRGCRVGGCQRLENQ